MAKDTFTSGIGLDRLTESQKKAVLHKDGPLLVLAGPGSGKTRVITCRIAALIEAGVRPYNICAITFTNKAADEMRQRVLTSGAARGVHISTFHSLCVQILRRYGEKAGIKPNFSIYDDADQKRCMKLAVKACNVDMTNFVPARMLNIVSGLKNDLEDVEAVTARGDDYFSKTLARIYTAYERILAANNALDFDDLLLRTAFLLRDFPDIRAELNDRFKYLLVDEYQDTNHSQYQIAKGLAIGHGNICVTGDPDQSIYRWRGADIGNILAFETDWPDAVVVKLEENFRSSPNILEMADKLIAFNMKRKVKSLIATRPRGQDVQIRGFADVAAESEAVAGQIKEAMEAEANLNEIAVFYRVNSMSRALEEAFIDEQIPYQVVRGVEFYARKEIRDMLGYLKLMTNPADDVAFLRAVGTHPRGIGKATLDRIASFGKINGIGMYDAARQSGRIETIGVGGRGRIAAFVGMIEGLRGRESGKVAEVMERVFEESGLENYLLSAGEKEQGAVENINELINAAGRYDETAEDGSLVDYLQSIALYSDTDAYEPASGKVSLMTLHAAKGLEFECVYIVGVEDGLLPHERSAGSVDEIEEERRLLFVGMTRAKEGLNISYARYRTIYGQFLRSRCSQFLYEVGYDEDDDFDELLPESSVGKSGCEMELKEGRGDVFAAGQSVAHKKFGIGVVKEFHDLGANSIAVVRFQSGKTKSLMVQYAKLMRVRS
jgi:DNA helicase-2/ATP-dependent DNA helicase PcrA